MSGRAVRLAAALAVAAATSFPAASKDPAPRAYRAELSVRWGADAGSDALRDDFERAAASRLGAACFAGVALAGPEDGHTADVRVDVVLSDVFDEIRYDDSIAGALQPGEPTQELRRVAEFSMIVDAQVKGAASGRLLAGKRFTTHAAHRPMYIGEDPQATVRFDAVADAVRELSRVLGCGKKLDKKIREDLAIPEQGPPAAR